MGKADHRKTRELDKARLAELTGQSSGDRTATPAVTLGRTKTLDDPLTTGLLAEVSRRSQTTEFDGDALDALREAMNEDDTAVIVDKPIKDSHPNVRRR
jgi:hypothetical protein